MTPLDVEEREDNLNLKSLKDIELSFWIGGYREIKENEFVWLDSGEATPFN